MAIEGVSSDDNKETYTRSASAPVVFVSTFPGASMSPGSTSGRPLGRPFARRYADLQGDDGCHPVDSIIDAVPAIAARARRLRRLSDQIGDQVTDRSSFIRYEDLRLEQQTDREELFFDAGHARGEVLGRQQSLEAAASRTAKGRALAREIATAALASDLPRAHVVAIVLESARALVLGHGPRDGGDA